MNKLLSTKALLIVCLTLILGGSKSFAQKYIETDINNLKTGDIVVIADKTSDNALPNTTKTSGTQSVKAITLNADKTEVASEVTDDLKWEITVNPEGTYLFKNPTSGEHLNIISNNKGVRVGAEQTAFTWEASVNKLKGNNRLIGVYNNQDWRSYTSNHTNIEGTVMAFYKQVNDGKKRADIEYAVTEHSVIFGEKFTAPTLTNPNNLVPTYTIECDPADMATIDAKTGEVTIKSTGVATITATTPEDATYYEGIASYTLTVTKSPANISFPAESYTINVGEEFTAPTLTNPNNLVPTYTIVCTPEGMAAIDAQTGKVTVNGAGKATITANTAETDKYEAATATYTLTVIDPNEKYTLLTDASTLKPGDVFIIIGKDESGTAKAMQKYVDGNNCKQTTDNVTISEDGCIYSPSAEAARITLGGEKDKWTLYDGTYYLYAASSSSNHLKGREAPTDDNDKATIASNADGTTSITFNGTNRSHLRYNLNSKLFSCYSSNTSQEPLYIYIKETSKAETGSFTISEDKYTTYYTEKAFVMPAGATGGIITAADKSNGTLTTDYRYTEGKTVPAKTALLIKGEPKTYEYTCTETTETADPNNMLHATVNAEGYTHVEGTNVKYYMLSHSADKTKFGFYWGEADGAPFKNKAPHAYLAITNATQAPAMFSIEGGEGTTGIGSIETETSEKTGVYSLTGVYMGTTTDNLPAGIYIKDGKKIIKK